MININLEELLDREDIKEIEDLANQYNTCIKEVIPLFLLKKYVYLKNNNGKKYAA